MTSLYYYSPTKFEMDSEDFRRFKTLFSTINFNISYIDRTDFIKTPIKTSYPDFQKLPSYDPDFSLSYEECCIKRAEEILKNQERLDVPIRLLYSGGIDSSTVLTSFINLLGQAEAEKRIQLYLSIESIEENPWMWERILRRSNFKFLDAEQYAGDFGRDRILVGGECNDLIWGSDIWKHLIALKGKSILVEPWTESIIEEYYRSTSISSQDAEMWSRIIIEKLRAAPCPVETCGDWLWWIAFTCKWGSFYFRQLAFARDTFCVNNDYLENYYYQFFASEDFQRWSMRNGDIKNYGGWTNYKWQSKEIVAKLCGNEYKQKLRKSSLWRLLMCKPGAKAITDNYEFIHNLDTSSWYTPNNSFNFQ